MDKYFIITIDTEGDNLWAAKDIKQQITTQNAKYLFRFQDLCEKYNFIPTYLTNYEMSRDSAMVELGRAGIKRHTLEIGAHEHAWNQPPFCPLVKRPGKRGKPYLAEYPKRFIKEKLTILTEILEDTFQCKIKSHRGGRWCLNQVIVEQLERLDYVVDCTCTPGIDWRSDPGWSPFSCGTNWSKYSASPFFLNSTNGVSHLLELPVTIIDQRSSGHMSWLRPNLYNLDEMLKLILYIKNSDLQYAEFMLHSSELMPGGSPIFTNIGKIDYLYKSLDEVFSCAKQFGFKGIGLTDYAYIYMKNGGKK